MGFITDPIKIGLDKKVDDIWDISTSVNET